MGVKANFTQKDVEAYLNKRFAVIHNRIISAFQFMGEQCLTEARTNKSYIDQTGNLTASMGYLVVADGQIVFAAGFEKDGGTTEGATGKTQGRSLAVNLAAGFTTGYALIVVAGMNYAYAVEAKGKNVLASAELLAEKKLPGLLKSLKLR
jgi:hypothetical protein